MMINWDVSPIRWETRRKIFLVADKPNFLDRINSEFGTTVTSEDVRAFALSALDGEYGNNVTEKMTKILLQENFNSQIEISE